MSLFGFLYSSVRLVLRGHAKANRIATHLTYQEKLFLYRSALTLRERAVIVEVGSYLGASSCFLAAAAEDKKGKVYSIDTWNNDGMSEGPRDTYREFYSNTERYRDTIIPIRGNSAHIAGKFTEKIDLLFIDGDHSYSGVMKDLAGWLPKLKKGCLLVLHDSGWAEGVQRAIRETVVHLQMGQPKVLPNLYAARVDTGKLTKREDALWP